jgi:hypothetical protein
MLIGTFGGISFNAGSFTSDAKRVCTMNSAFALVLTVFLVSGEPVDIAVSVHRTMQECMTAATEQKIPGNCYPVDKVIHQDNIEIPAGL